MYTNGDLIKDCLDLFVKTEGNIVEIPGVGETVIFEEPIFGFASAKDEIFEIFRRKGSHWRKLFRPVSMAPRGKVSNGFVFAVLGGSTLEQQG